MRLLLDTHAFLWWLDGDELLPAPARDAIADTLNDVLVSAASVWEIATKFRIGKLPGAAEVAADVPKCIAQQGFESVSVTTQHAQRAGSLLGTHRDPFDRMLIAQACLDDLILVSNETLFDAYGVRRLWTRPYSAHHSG
jgi:PIN domain nuclease of toxin-antitoxin system